jgi:hypothetical protein
LVYFVAVTGLVAVSPATAQLQNDSSAATTDKWTGGFIGRSGITWSYKAQTKDREVRVTVRGQKDSKVYNAFCSPTALNNAETFETTCQYEGGNFGFKVRGRIDGDVIYALYLAENGDRASLSLVRETITSSPTAESPSAPQGSTAQSSNRSAQSQPHTANLQLPSCKDFRVLSTYTHLSFVNSDDPILGVPPAQWNAPMLASVFQWAQDCVQKVGGSSPERSP